MQEVRRLGAPRLLALAICIGFGLAFVISNVRSWELEDAEAYWNAALRLRDGQALYIAVDPGADETIAYRYAPRLAWTWVPLTFLPKGEAGDSLSLLSIAGPIPWVVLAAGAGMAALLLARARIAWAAASVAVLAVVPRLELYGLTYLLVGLNATSWRGSTDRRPSRSDA